MIGRNSDSIETLQSCIELLHERGQGASIPGDDLNLRLARLNNELGTMYASELYASELYDSDYRRDESAQCYQSAIEAATQIDGYNVAGKIELARAYLNAGNQPRHLRRIESLTQQQRSDDLAQVNQAIRLQARLMQTWPESVRHRAILIDVLELRSGQSIKGVRRQFFWHAVSGFVHPAF